MNFLMCFVFGESMLPSVFFATCNGHCTQHIWCNRTTDDKTTWEIHCQAFSLLKIDFCVNVKCINTVCKCHPLLKHFIFLCTEVVTVDNKVVINQNNADTRANPVNFAGAYWYFHYRSQYLHAEGQLNRRAVVRVRCLSLCSAAWGDILVFWLLSRWMSTLMGDVSIYFWVNLLNVSWSSLKLSMSKQRVLNWQTFEQTTVKKMIYATSMITEPACVYCNQFRTDDLNFRCKKVIRNVHVQ